MEPPNIQVIDSRRAIDLQIGQRLRQIRGRIPQQELSDAIGIKKQRYSSYEYGRVPLRFQVAWRICKYFNVNQIWLRTGQGKTTGFIHLDLGKYERQINDRTTFEEGYECVARDFEKAIPLLSDDNAAQEQPTDASQPPISISACLPAELEKYRIEILNIDQERGYLEITPPAWASMSRSTSRIRLQNPGFLAVRRIMRRFQNDPDLLEFELLRACLPDHQASEEFLKTLNYYFVVALEDAAMRLINLVPVTSPASIPPDSNLTPDSEDNIDQEKDNSTADLEKPTTEANQPEDSNPPEKLSG